MEQHEADLIRDLIAANRSDVLARIDAQGKDIAEIKNDIRKLQEEYDQVLIAMKAAEKAAHEVKSTIRFWSATIGSMLSILVVVFELLHIVRIIP